MKELEKLFESELLNDETKQELAEAIQAIKEQAITEARKELEVEYATKLTEAKEEIATKLNEAVEQSVISEIEELKEDIQRYRGLEVEYAKKLEEFKAEYAEKLNASFSEIIEEQVKAEIEELRGDLEQAKKDHFGRRIFEAFKEDFEEFGITEDIKEVRASLEETQRKLEESEQKLAQLERERIMESLLEGLKGSKREVMKTILENVATDKLEERFNETIDAVLEEKKEGSKEQQLTESDEGVEVMAADLNQEIARMRRLAGFKD